MLSHVNVASNAWDAFSLIESDPAGDPVLSVLPFAHIYENTDMFGYFIRGAEIYVTGRSKAARRFAAVRPVAVFAVPRIFERTYAGILAKSRAAGGLRAKLVPWALDAAGATSARNTTGRPDFPSLRANSRSRTSWSSASSARNWAATGCAFSSAAAPRCTSTSPDLRRARTCRSWKVTASPSARRSSPSTTPAGKLGTVGPPIPAWSSPRRRR